MEKLEKVLAAEEGARRALAQAREDAARIHAEAVDESRRIRETAAANAAGEAAADRDRVLRAAEARSVTLLEEADRARESAVEQARGRLDVGAARLAARLTGD